MEYDLSRIDYTICGITFPDTLKILPSSGLKSQQKFAVGDKNGVLQCLTIKDEDPVVQFKTLPGKSITSVQLASGNVAHGDKIFAASGNEVKGYTRKGKVFLNIETSLSETITSMCIIGGDLILCSGRTLTYYRDLKECHSYLCEDRVLDIAAFAAPNSSRIRLLVLVANKGAVILDGGQLVTRIAISSGPSRLTVPPSIPPTCFYAFYGAVDGSIGIINYKESSLSSTCLVEGRGLGSVVSIGWFFNNSGAHLAIGRHDGSIQLYLLDLERINEKPILKFTYFCGEPVTSVEGGRVGTEENELLVATYSGRIFALRSIRLISGAGRLADLPQDALATRRSKLETEIARLEKQTGNEREKYQRSTRSLQGGLSMPPLLDIQYELTGATREGWQEMRIVSAVPLDMLFMYCSYKMELLTDSAAVLSLCPPQQTPEDLLATVRCQAGTRRLWIRMRYVMSLDTRVTESVKVYIYALPAGAPRVARLITLQLPALPYYSQHVDADSDDKRSWCKVFVSGNFSVAEMTAWLAEALPGDLPRPAANVAFGRTHTLLRTVLICQYQRGMATFKSDNVSTIAVIRDVITNCSVKKRIRVDTTYDIPEDCCTQSFNIIKEQYIIEYQKYKNDKLSKALIALDLDTSINNEPVLCKDYLEVYTETALKNNFIELVENIEQWYLDWRVLSLNKSGDGEHHRVKLKNALRECRTEDILKTLSNEVLTPDKQVESNI